MCVNLDMPMLGVQIYLSENVGVFKNVSAL